jgi:hypothetical protein
VRYHRWAKEANFESKLPGDVRKRKDALAEIGRTLDGDLRENVKEIIIPYSVKLFRRKAVEWIAATDQVSLYIVTNPLI